MKNRPFSYWQNVATTYKTRVSLTGDGIVRVSRKNATSYNIENLKKVSRDK